MKRSLWQLIMKKNFENQLFSAFQWEALAVQTSNTINNHPLALENVTGDLHNFDLITPSNTSLGHNSDLSPVGSLVVSSAIIPALEETTWFENWLISQVLNLMHHSKWFDNERDLKIRGIILFLKHCTSFKNTCQYGSVENVKYNREENIRRVKMKHRNDNEKTKGDVQYPKNWWTCNSWYYEVYIIITMSSFICSFVALPITENQ